MWFVEYVQAFIIAQFLCDAHLVKILVSFSKELIDSPCGLIDSHTVPNISGSQEIFRARYFSAVSRGNGQFFCSLQNQTAQC